MGLGLQGAYGLQGAQGALRQRLIDRMAMEQQQQQMEMQRAHLALQTRQIAGQEEDRRTDNARQAAAEARILQGAEDTSTEKRFALTPVDAPMPPSLALKSRALGLPITATPGQPVQQLQGFSTLPGDPQDASAAPMQQQLRVRSLPADPLAVPDRFTRGATQADTEKTLADTRATTAQSELGRHNVAMETAAGVTAKRGDAAQQETARHNRAVEGANIGNRDLANQLKELQIRSASDKLDATQKDRQTKEDSARQSTASALDLVDRLEKHPGLPMASGYISSRFADFSQDATDANGIRDQLVATLTLPNLGTLKGPMSDRDVIFVKQLATRLGNPRLSEAETRKALKEAKAFLRSKSDAQGGAKPSGGSSGGDGLSYQDYLNSRKNTK